MSTGKRTLAVVSADGTVPDDVSAPLTRGGFAIRAFLLSVADIPAEAVAVLVIVTDRPDAAMAFTRRCRIEAESPRPVVWLFDAAAVHSAPTGFDSGADVCLVRPVDPDVLLAQVNVLLRSYTELSRVFGRGADRVDLAARLSKVLRQSDADTALARRILSQFPQTEPLTVGHLAAAWVHVPAARGGLNTFGVVPCGDGLRFALCSVGGLGVPAGAALVEAVTRHLLAHQTPPVAALADVSRRVGELALPDAAIVAATVGTIDAGGTASVACGGHPAPVFVPADGPAKLWHGVGPFLGQSAAGYGELAGELNVGDRLLLLAGGAAADKRPDVRAAADEHIGGSLSDFVQRVSDGVFTPADADDGWTLLAVGRTEAASGTIPALTEPVQ
jgi:DNA-binding response OmpR family regulator